VPERSVKVSFAQQTLLHRVDERLIVLTVPGDGEEVGAFIVHPGFDRYRRSFGVALRKVMALVDVYNRIAVGNHEQVSESLPMFPFVLSNPA
jgi:hypothetical protein